MVHGISALPRRARWNSAARLIFSESPLARDWRLSPDRNLLYAPSAT
jgi:hypothetical protein